MSLALTLTIISTLALPPTRIEAPALPAWRGDLPQAQASPEGGTYLPPPLDDEVLKRLLFLDRYPELCQGSIDAATDLGNMRAEAAAEEASRHTWQWPAAIGVLTGVAAGYFYGHH